MNNIILSNQSSGLPSQKEKNSKKNKSEYHNFS